jgi:thioredoxin-related protein
MKLFALLFTASLFLNPSTNWLTDIEKAKTEATQNRKKMLLNFAGSDWCIPCIKMKTEIFESEAFKAYADKNLVLIKADFPRLKKNKLEAKQVKHNEALAEKYNKKGVFPFTVLLDANGKVLKTWEGFQKVNPNDFVKQIELVANAR